MSQQQQQQQQQQSQSQLLTLKLAYSPLNTNSNNNPILPSITVPLDLVLSECPLIAAEYIKHSNNTIQTPTKNNNNKDSIKLTHITRIRRTPTSKSAAAALTSATGTATAAVDTNSNSNNNNNNTPTNSYIIHCYKYPTTALTQPSIQLFFTLLQYIPLLQSYIDQLVNLLYTFNAHSQSANTIKSLYTNNINNAVELESLMNVLHSEYIKIHHKLYSEIQLKYELILTAINRTIVTPITVSEWFELLILANIFHCRSLRIIILSIMAHSFNQYKSRNEWQSSIFLGKSNYSILIENYKKLIQLTTIKINSAAITNNTESATAVTVPIQSPAAKSQFKSKMNIKSSTPTAAAAQRVQSNKLSINPLASPQNHSHNHNHNQPKNKQLNRNYSASSIHSNSNNNIPYTPAFNVMNATGSGSGSGSRPSTAQSQSLSQSNSQSNIITAPSLLMNENHIYMNLTEADIEQDNDTQSEQQNTTVDSDPAADEDDDNDYRSDSEVQTRTTAESDDYVSDYDESVPVAQSAVPVVSFNPFKSQSTTGNSINSDSIESESMYNALQGLNAHLIEQPNTIKPVSQSQSNSTNESKSQSRSSSVASDLESIDVLLAQARATAALSASMMQQQSTTVKFHPSTATTTATAAVDFKPVTAPASTDNITPNRTAIKPNLALLSARMKKPTK